MKKNLLFILIIFTFLLSSITNSATLPSNSLGQPTNPYIFVAPPVSSNPLQMVTYKEKIKISGILQIKDIKSSKNIPVSAGNYDVKISVWDNLTNGNKLWEENKNAVSVDENGIFFIELDQFDQSPNIKFDYNYFVQIEVTIPGNPPTTITLDPRQEMTWVPYALNSKRLGGKDLIELKTEITNSLPGSILDAVVKKPTAEQKITTNSTFIPLVIEQIDPNSLLPAFSASNNGKGPGIYGSSENSYGILGKSINAFGLAGTSKNFIGIYGYSENALGSGIYGKSDNGIGIVAESINNTALSASSVQGSAAKFENNNAIPTITAENKNSSGKAAKFIGDVEITGNLIGGNLNQSDAVVKNPNAAQIITVNAHFIPLAIEQVNSNIALPAFKASNNGTGLGIMGFSKNNYGIYGHSENNSGIFGYSKNNYGIDGYSENSAGIYGHSENSYAGFFSQTRNTATAPVLEIVNKGMGKGLNILQENIQATQSALYIENSGRDVAAIHAKSPALSGIAGIFDGAVDINGDLTNKGNVYINGKTKAFISDVTSSATVLNVEHKGIGKAAEFIGSSKFENNSSSVATVVVKNSNITANSKAAEFIGDLLIDGNITFRNKKVIEKFYNATFVIPLAYANGEMSGYIENVIGKGDLSYYTPRFKKAFLEPAYGVIPLNLPSGTKIDSVELYFITSQRGAFSCELVNAIKPVYGKTEKIIKQISQITSSNGDTATVFPINHTISSNENLHLTIIFSSSDSTENYFIGANVKYISPLERISGSQ